MNKLFKILMVIAVCAAMLMMFGCKNEPAGNTNGGETQGTSNQGGQTQGDDVDSNVTQNPEGDPFDSTSGDDDQGDVPTEPPIGIEDPTEDTAEDDLEIDFGDLIGN